MSSFPHRKIPHMHTKKKQKNGGSFQQKYIFSPITCGVKKLRKYACIVWRYVLSAIKTCVEVCVQLLRLVLRHIYYKMVVEKTNRISKYIGVFALGLAVALLITLHKTKHIPEDILPLSPIGAIGTEDSIVDPVTPTSTDSDFDSSILQSPVHQVLIVQKGNSLESILTKANIANDNRRQMLLATVKKTYNVERMDAGQKITIDGVGGYPAYTNFHVQTMEIYVDAQTSLLVYWDKGEYRTKRQQHPLIKNQKRIKGTIVHNVYTAMANKGIKRAMILDFLHLFTFDVDFQRDVRKGDSFDIIFSQYTTKEGTFVRNGPIEMAELSVQDHPIRFYRYTTAKGNTHYYTPEGKSIQKALMKTPIEGARISSSFGPRKHPVLGYTKMHKGTDFAAPKGTPIFAAGDGVIEKAGTFGSFGTYVRIRHNSVYKTAYGHMSKLAKTIHVGKRVKQGQVIGYVGSTGQSTGNHLHYEVHKNGVAINSRTMKLPAVKSLTGEELRAFKKYSTQLSKDSL